MATGNSVTFDAKQSPTRLPPGTYTGEIVEADHALGGNGMDRQWRTVVIADGELAGTRVCIFTEGANDASQADSG